MKHLVCRNHSKRRKSVFVVPLRQTRTALGARGNLRKYAVVRAVPRTVGRGPQTVRPLGSAAQRSGRHTWCRFDDRFSNRPVGVKRFQALQYSDGNVARGLVLLYGLGTSARPSWDSKTRWNDLLGGLAVGRSKRTCELTSSIVPRGT